MTEKKIVANYNQTLENIDRNYLIKEKKYCIKTKFQIMTDNVKIWIQFIIVISKLKGEKVSTQVNWDNPIFCFAINIYILID